MKKKLSPLFYLCLSVILIIIAFFIKILFFNSSPEFFYLTAPAKRDNIELTVLADGYIEAAKMVNVGAQVSGQIKALHVVLGDKVVTGQAIAEIDDLPQQNNLKEAKANLQNLQAQKSSREATLRSNRLTYQRYKKLLATGAIAKADYDVAKANYYANLADISALNAQITKAQIAVDTANLNLGYTKINSPLEGVVVAIPIEAGQTVNAVQSAPTIIKVAQLDTMTIKAQISEADIAKVKPNMPVYFTTLGEPNKKYQATLRSIEPAPTTINTDSVANSNSGAVFYNGIFDVPNPDQTLRIAMTAQVYIVLEQAKDTITIPATALKNINYTTHEATVKLLTQPNLPPITRTVKIGINNNVDAQVLSGLNEGEQVVISDVTTLTPNSYPPKVRLRM